MTILLFWMELLWILKILGIVKYTAAITPPFFPHVRWGEIMNLVMNSTADFAVCEVLTYDRKVSRAEMDNLSQELLTRIFFGNDAESGNYACWKFLKHDWFQCLMERFTSTNNLILVVTNSTLLVRVGSPARDCGRPWGRPSVLYRAFRGRMRYALWWSHWMLLGHRLYFQFHCLQLPGNP